MPHVRLRESLCKAGEKPLHGSIPRPPDLERNLVAPGAIAPPSAAQSAKSFALRTQTTEHSVGADHDQLASLRPSSQAGCSIPSPTSPGGPPSPGLFSCPRGKGYPFLRGEATLQSLGHFLLGSP